MIFFVLYFIQCLGAEGILKAYGLSKDIIHPPDFIKLCPAIVVQLDDNACYHDYGGSNNEHKEHDHDHGQMENKTDTNTSSSPAQGKH